MTGKEKKRTGKKRKKSKTIVTTKTRTMLNLSKREKEVIRNMTND